MLIWAKGDPATGPKQPGRRRARKRALPAVAYSHFAGAASNLLLQLPRYRRKLIQRCLQVVGYLLG